MAKQKQVIKREYEARAISAHPDWWRKVDETADEMDVNRSALIRMAVNEYLKADGAESHAAEAPLAA